MQIQFNNIERNQYWKETYGSRTQFESVIVTTEISLRLLMTIDNKIGYYLSGNKIVERVILCTAIMKVVNMLILNIL